MSALALAGGALVSAALVRRRRKNMEDKNERKDRGRSNPADRWARPGMAVTFRAELMPGRSRAERTFRVVKLLPSGRVALENFAGEHAEQEFEAAR